MNELVGKRVRLIQMHDAYTPLLPGAKGTVVFVDDLGTVHMKWDNGSHLGLIPGVDEWEYIEESK